MMIGKIQSGINFNGLLESKQRKSQAAVDKFLDCDKSKTVFDAYTTALNSMDKLSNELMPWENFVLVGEYVDPWSDDFIWSDQPEKNAWNKQSNDEFASYIKLKILNIGQLGKADGCVPAAEISISPDASAKVRMNELYSLVNQFTNKMYKRKGLDLVA